MNASGDIGDFSDFTISSGNDEDVSESGSADNTATPNHFQMTKDKLTEFQLLKIELSKKSLELENCHKTFLRQEEQMQDRIDALVHQRDAIQHQLEHEIRLHQHDSFKRQEQIRYQLEQATKHQNYLESTNEKMIQSTLELKNILAENLRVDHDKYIDLSMKSEYELSVRELLQVKIYQILQPILKECSNLKYENSEMIIEKNDLINELKNVQSCFTEEQEQHQTLQKEFNKMLLELSDLKDKVQIGNYKIENFDRIQKNCDNFEEKFNQASLELNKLQMNFINLENERDQLIKIQSDLSQSNRLMTLDKEYLTKQVNELNCRCSNAEDRLQNAWRQLDESKASREQLYDKYVVSRDEFRTQYENRLKEELDSLRLKTEHEMEKIKNSTKELFDRENKSLLEQKDIAVSDRDIAVRNLKEIEEKLGKVKFEFSAYQAASENKISELLNEIKMKSFESERNTILYDECCNKLKMSNLECEKYQAKCEVLTKEYYQMESSTSKKISELEMKLEETTKKISSYEKLEQELDLAVMHAAEDESGGRPVLMWPHGYDSGNPLPTQAGRRMQHSIELARRILHLERMLKERNEKIELQTKELLNLQQNLELSERILNEAKQPYSYLIDALKKRDSEITKLKLIQKDLTNQLNKVRREKSKICDEKNRMACDLEQLFKQKDEFVKLKKIVEELRDDREARSTVSINKLPCKELPDSSRNVPNNVFKNTNQEYSVSRA